MNEEVESMHCQKTVENPRTAMGSEANRSASGSIEKATAASRTPLANPSAHDMKSVVGVTQSAIRPPIGEARAAAPTIPTMVEKSASPTYRQCSDNPEHVQINRELTKVHQSCATHVAKNNQSGLLSGKIKSTIAGVARKRQHFTEMIQRRNRDCTRSTHLENVFHRLIRT
jgi:hypothetical protein